MGRGQRGEGFSGTAIKDTWTKPRGRVEAREGGGFGWGGGKIQTTVIEQQLNNLKIGKKRDLLIQNSSQNINQNNWKMYTM